MTVTFDRGRVSRIQPRWVRHEEAGRRGPPVTLFWGEDEFLLRDAAGALLAELGVRRDEVAASDWQGGETSNLSTPSLLGERRALLVLGAAVAPRSAAADELAATSPRRSPTPSWC